MLALEEEWRYRFKHEKEHKSVLLLLTANIRKRAYMCFKVDFTNLPNITPPALAMPGHCIVPGNLVESYRKYYREEKVHLHKWTNREVPYWL